MAPTAMAEPKISAENIAAYEAADEDHRVHILIRLCQERFVNAAEAMLQRYPLQGPKARNRTLFIHGLIAEARGELHNAASDFRAALADDPHLTLVRAELAKVLAQMDENASAKHHLELLAGETKDPQQLAGIHSFMEQLDAKHPYSFSAYVSLAPSTNINQGSSQTTVYTPGLSGIAGVSPVGTIAPSSLAQSGIGMTAGGNAGFSHRFGDHLQGVIAAGVAATYYPSSYITALNGSESAEMRYLNDTGYFGLGVAASEAGNPLNLALGYDSIGPRASMLQRIGTRDQLVSTLGYEWRSYPQSTSSNGNALTGSSIFTHALDSTSNIALIAGFENVTQQLAFNSYNDLTVGVGFYKELSRGVTLEGQGTARTALFNAMNPLTLSTRTDENLTGSLTLTKRDWYLFGFAPSVNYTYVRNISNIGLYDYNCNSLDVRLTKNF